MAKAKSGTKVDTSKLVAIVAILLVVFLGYKYIAKFNTNNTDQPDKISKNYSGSPDIENDGVYTNNEYGFKFNYNSSIFKIMTPGGKVFYESKFDTGTKDNDWVGRGLMLSIETVPSTDTYYQVFENDQTLKLNEPKYSIQYLNDVDPSSRPIENRIKVSTFQDGHVIYSYSLPQSDIEPFFGYTAVWKKNNSLIKVDVFDFMNDSRKAEQLSLINKIISTMQFFDPSTSVN